MTLVARTVLAVGKEANEGVAAALTASDTIETLSYPTLSPNLESLTREVAGGSLTQSPPVSARQRGSLEIPMELAGISTGVATTPPSWAPFMESAAMKQTAVKALKTNGVTSGPGIFAHDAALTFSASGATARNVGVFRGTEHLWIFVEVLTGAIGANDTSVTDGTTVIDLDQGNLDIRDGFAWEPWDVQLGQIGVASVTGGGPDENDLMVGGTSGARARCYKSLAGAGTLVFEKWLGSPPFETGEVITCTPGGGTATTNTGETANSFPSLTIFKEANGLRKAVVGARCQWQISLENGSYAALRFTAEGRHDKPTEVVPLAGPAKRGAKPPRVSGTVFKINGQHVICIKTFRIQSENVIALRECMSESSGYKSTLITGRKITGQIDPEAVSEGLVPILGWAWEKTPFRVEAIIGDVTLKNGNSFVIRGDQVTATNYTDADRDKLAIHNMPLAFGGGTRDEFFLYAM